MNIACFTWPSKRSLIPLSAAGFALRSSKPSEVSQETTKLTAGALAGTSTTLPVTVSRRLVSMGERRTLSSGRGELATDRLTRWQVWGGSGAPLSPRGCAPRPVCQRSDEGVHLIAAGSPPLSWQRHQLTRWQAWGRKIDHRWRRAPSRAPRPPRCQSPCRRRSRGS